MRVKQRRYYRHRGAVVFRITCVLIIGLIGILLLDAKLRPAVYDLVALEACALSSKTVNSAVEKTLSEKAPSYAETVTVTYGESGISGITTDVIKMNLFKSQVSNEIDSAFDENKSTDIAVSLGSASGIALFSGWGPYVDIPISFSSSTKSDFENVFTSAGINQTQHSIMLNVETTVMLTLPGKRITETVATSFCVAQTVIVGSVPSVMVE